MQSVPFIKLLTFCLAIIIHLNLTAQELLKVVPEEVGMSTERLARLTSTLETYINNGELPGTVALVARRGKIAYFQSLGKSDLEAGYWVWPGIFPYARFGFTG